jgi:hypothetical protein
LAGLGWFPSSLPLRDRLGCFSGGLRLELRAGLLLFHELAPRNLCGALVPCACTQQFSGVRQPCAIKRGGGFPTPVRVRRRCPLVPDSVPPGVGGALPSHCVGCGSKFRWSKLSGNFRYHHSNRYFRTNTKLRIRPFLGANYSRAANRGFFEARFCNSTSFEARLHEIAAVTPVIPQIFSPIGYLDRDRYVGLHMIKRSAPLKGRLLGTTSHLRLDTRVRCGHHPVRLPRIRGG